MSFKNSPFEVVLPWFVNQELESQGHSEPFQPDSTSLQSLIDIRTLFGRDFRLMTGGKMILWHWILRC